MTIPRTPSFKLTGKKALVTGASKGIGFAASVALAEAGAELTLAARTESELITACEAITQIGAKCTYVVLDVTSPDDVNRVVQAKGPFQILVNSAGMNRPKNLVDLEDQDIDDILNLNVKSCFYVTRAMAKGLIKSGLTGSIINISSQMGLVGSPKRTLYCASKHAIEGMTKALSWELGPKGIRVNTLCPTFIETALTENMFKDEEFKIWVTSKIALGRIGKVEEMMGAVVFLASDASSLMTGSALMLDGGWTAA